MKKRVLENIHIAFPSFLSCQKSRSPAASTKITDTEFITREHLYSRMIINISRWNWRCWQVDNCTNMWRERLTFSFPSAQNICFDIPNELTFTVGKRLICGIFFFIEIVEFNIWYEANWLMDLLRAARVIKKEVHLKRFYRKDSNTECVNGAEEKSLPLKNVK